VIVDNRLSVGMPILRSSNPISWFWRREDIAIARGVVSSNGNLEERVTIDDIHKFCRALGHITFEVSGLLCARNAVSGEIVNPTLPIC